MLITLMFSVVAVKSRTFSSFSYSAQEQEPRGSAASQPSCPVEILHTMGITLSSGMGLARGQEALCTFLFP